MRRLVRRAWVRRAEVQPGVVLAEVADTESNNFTLGPAEDLSGNTGALRDPTILASRCRSADLARATRCIRPGRW
jgi:hypothetical protein